MKTTYKNKLMIVSLSLFMSTTWLLACNNNGDGTTDDMDTTGVVEQGVYNGNTDNTGAGNPGNTGDINSNNATNAESGTFPADGNTNTGTSTNPRQDSVNNELKSHGNIQESNVPR